MLACPDLPRKMAGAQLCFERMPRNFALTTLPVRLEYVPERVVAVHTALKRKGLAVLNNADRRQFTTKPTSRYDSLTVVSPREAAGGRGKP